jgi:hypothetical protein
LKFCSLALVAASFGFCRLAFASQPSASARAEAEAQKANARHRLQRAALTGDSVFGSPARHPRRLVIPALLSPHARPRRSHPPPPASAAMDSGPQKPQQINFVHRLFA